MTTLKYLTADRLEIHSKNVRARVGYTEESITRLAVSIKSLGLLQSLVVQQEPDSEKIGVLAGGRRLHALALNIKTKAIPADTKIPCLVVPKGVDTVTAISYAENEMQEQMDPLSEFEAFAAMVDEGMTIDQIAEDFSTEIRSVKERLRYGKVHPDIREAARGRQITLDAMKAFACHPCQNTQLRTFAALSKDDGVQAWRVRDVLNAEDIRGDDPMAFAVMDAYRAAKGEVVDGLFPEDTRLKDRALVEALLLKHLTEQAEAVADAEGFAWGAGSLTYDVSEIGTYGRIYPKQREPNKRETKRIEKIAERIEAIEIEMEDEELSQEAYDALEEEIYDLNDEAEAIQNAFDRTELKRAGVFAIWRNGEVSIERGFVKPEDLAALRGDDEPSDDASVAGENAGTDTFGRTDDPAPVEVKLSQALRDDLAVERAMIVAANIAVDPGLAYDMAVFTLAQRIIAPSFADMGGLALSANASHRHHSRPEAQTEDVAEALTAAHDALDLSFCDSGLTTGAQFRSFQALDPEMKAAILAYTISVMINPALAPNGEYRDSFVDAFISQAVPDVRAHWTPSDANYWSRVTRPMMLSVLKDDLGLEQEAETHASAKKSTLSAFMGKLFAEPFATLSAEQHAAVGAWVPAVMETAAPDDADTAAADEVEAADDAADQAVAA